MILIILKLGTITFYVALTIAADLIFVPIGYYLTHNLLLLMEKEKKESSKVKDIV